MKESYGKDRASHPDPESCVGGRKGAGEALTGAHAGQPSSCEIQPFGVPTPLSEAEGHTEGGAIGEPPEDPAQSETLCMRGNPSRGKREIPRVPAGDGTAGRPGKVTSRNPGMNVRGKSDDRIVPAKPPNNAGDDPAAEAVEGRRSTEGNTRCRRPHPGLRAGSMRRSPCNVCARQHAGTSVRGSPPCFTM